MYFCDICKDNGSKCSYCGESINLQPVEVKYYLTYDELSSGVRNAVDILHKLGLLSICALYESTPAENIDLNGTIVA